MRGLGGFVDPQVMNSGIAFPDQRASDFLLGYLFEVVVGQGPVDATLD